MSTTARFSQPPTMRAQGNRPLHVATANSQGTAAELLIKLGAGANVLNSVRIKSFIALSLLFAGQTDCLNYLRGPCAHIQSGSHTSVRRMPGHLSTTRRLMACM